MVVGCRETGSEGCVRGVCWVCDEEAYFAGQTDWEGLQDVVCSLAEVGAELGVVGSVEEEVAKAVIRVHYGNGGVANIAVKSETVVGDV